MRRALHELEQELLHTRQAIRDLFAVLDGNLVITKFSEYYIVGLSSNNQYTFYKINKNVYDIITSALAGEADED